MKNSIKTSEYIELPKKDFLELLKLYQKIGKILTSQKTKKPTSSLKSLYGIWKKTKITEEEINQAKKSLFKFSSKNTL